MEEKEWVLRRKNMLSRFEKSDGLTGLLFRVNSINDVNHGVGQGIDFIFEEITAQA